MNFLLCDVSMSNGPLNGYQEVPCSVRSVPGFVRVLHPEVSAEAMEQLFIDFVTENLGLYSRLIVTPTPNGSQLMGTYRGNDNALLFTTTRNPHVPFRVFGDGEAVLHETASSFTVNSAPSRTRELDDLVDQFGRHLLNGHELPQEQSQRHYWL